MANPKGELIARAQREGLGKPQFKTSIAGPDHEPTFHAEVVLQELSIGKGEGPNKKVAEKRAAEEAIKYLDSPPQEEVNEVLGEFSGPYPIFENVLAESLRIANKRTDSKLTGQAAMSQIKDLTLILYKELLVNLGEVLEVDDIQ
jgi:Double-stranded RNA binding motif